MFSGNAQIQENNQDTSERIEPILSAVGDIAGSLINSQVSNKGISTYVSVKTAAPGILLAWGNEKQRQWEAGTLNPAGYAAVKVSAEVGLGLLLPTSLSAIATFDACLESIAPKTYQKLHENIDNLEQNFVEHDPRRKPGEGFWEYTNRMQLSRDAKEAVTSARQGKVARELQSKVGETVADFIVGGRKENGESSTTTNESREQPQDSSSNTSSIQSDGTNENHHTEDTLFPSSTAGRPKSDFPSDPKTWSEITPYINGIPNGVAIGITSTNNPIDMNISIGVEVSGIDAIVTDWLNRGLSTSHLGEGTITVFGEVFEYSLKSEGISKVKLKVKHQETRHRKDVTYDLKRKWNVGNKKNQPRLVKNLNLLVTEHFRDLFQERNATLANEYNAALSSNNFSKATQLVHDYSRKYSQYPGVTENSNRMLQALQNTENLFRFRQIEQSNREQLTALQQDSGYLDSQEHIQQRLNSLITGDIKEKISLNDFNGARLDAEQLSDKNYASVISEYINQQQDEHLETRIFDLLAEDCYAEARELSQEFIDKSFKEIFKKNIDRSEDLSISLKVMKLIEEKKFDEARTACKGMIDPANRERLAAAIDTDSQQYNQLLAEHLYQTLHSQFNQNDQEIDFGYLEKEIQHGLALNPEHNGLKQDLIMSYFHQGEYEKLITYAKANILEQTPDDLFALSMIGNAQLNMGNVAEGRQTLLKVIELSSEDGFAHHLLAQSYQKELDELSDSLSHAFDIFQENIDRKTKYLMPGIESELKDSIEYLEKIKKITDDRDKHLEFVPDAEISEAEKNAQKHREEFAKRCKLETKLLPPRYMQCRAQTAEMFSDLVYVISKYFIGKEESQNCQDLTHAHTFASSISQLFSHYSYREIQALMGVQENNLGFGLNMSRYATLTMQAFDSVFKLVRSQLILPCLTKEQTKTYQPYLDQYDVVVNKYILPAVQLLTSAGFACMEPDYKRAGIYSLSLSSLLKIPQVEKYFLDPKDSGWGGFFRFTTGQFLINLNEADWVKDLSQLISPAVNSTTDALVKSAYVSWFLDVLRAREKKLPAWITSYATIPNWINLENFNFSTLTNAVGYLNTFNIPLLSWAAWIGIYSIELELWVEYVTFFYIPMVLGRAGYALSKALCDQSAWAQYKQEIASASSSIELLEKAENTAMPEESIALLIGRVGLHKSTSANDIHASMHPSPEVIAKNGK